MRIGVSASACQVLSASLSFPLIEAPTEEWRGALSTDHLLSGTSQALVLVSGPERECWGREAGLTSYSVSLIADPLKGVVKGHAVRGFRAWLSEVVGSFSL